MRKAAGVILILLAPLLIALVLIRHFGGYEALSGSDLIILLGSAPDFGLLTRNSLLFAKRVLSFQDASAFFDSVVKDFAEIMQGNAPFGAIPVPDVPGFKELVQGINLVVNSIAQMFRIVESAIMFMGSAVVGTSALIAAALCFLFEPIELAGWLVFRVILASDILPVSA